MSNRIQATGLYPTSSLSGAIGEFDFEITGSPNAPFSPPADEVPSMSLDDSRTPTSCGRSSGQKERTGNAQSIATKILALRQVPNPKSEKVLHVYLPNDGEVESSIKPLSPGEVSKKFDIQKEHLDAEKRLAEMKLGELEREIERIKAILGQCEIQSAIHRVIEELKGTPVKEKNGQVLPGSKIASLNVPTEPSVFDSVGFNPKMI